MAQKTRTELGTAITTLLADNTAGEISAEDIRNVLQDLVDSLSNLKDDPARPLSRRLTSQVNTSSATAAAVTALRVPVKSGRVYNFRCSLLIQGASGSSGSKLGISNDGFAGTLAYVVRNLNAAGNDVIGRSNQYGQVHTTGGFPTADATYWVDVKGTLIPDDDGEFGPDFGSSLDGTQVRMLIGSNITVRDVTNNY